MVKVSGPAWQLRQAQRQHFIEHWQRRVFDEMETREENGDLFLLQVLLNLLSYAGLQLQEKRGFTSDEATELVTLFTQEAQKFARVPTEVLVLVQDLFQKLEASLWSVLCSPYQQDEFHRTRETLGAARASDEIEVDLDED